MAHHHQPGYQYSFINFLDSSDLFFFFHATIVTLRQVVNAIRSSASCIIYFEELEQVSAVPAKALFILLFSHIFYFIVIPSAASWDQCLWELEQWPQAAPLSLCLWLHGRSSSAMR